MKKRADILLTEQGLVKSREQAQALIMAGQVYVKEKKIIKPSEALDENEKLIIRGEIDQIASRGYHKLEKAITYFQADVGGQVCMDIGAASGGFTDVLLRNGAKHVYAIDVGYGQLDWRLRQDDRVTVMERTNARLLTKDMFPVSPTLTVMDVSFISIKLILPVAADIMGESGRFLTLIKPQFEAGREKIGKNGVVREESTHRQVLRGICDFVPSFGWYVQGLTYSPITGPKGNIEFLADIQPKECAPITDEAIHTLVAAAHQELRK
ncbi:MAG: TlyA family RNA methyltransferase [Clostridia bacterium]|nr:TlyA family RNA methyltransferase [Clostridia bacterium]